MYSCAAHRTYLFPAQPPLTTGLPGAVAIHPEEIAAPNMCDGTRPALPVVMEHRYR